MRKLLMFQIFFFLCIFSFCALLLISQVKNTPAAETRHLDEAEREGDAETEGSGTDAPIGELDSSNNSKFSLPKSKNVVRHRHRSRPDETGNNSHPREQLSASDADELSGPSGLETRMDRPSFNSSKSPFERKLNAFFAAYSPRYHSNIIKSIFLLLTIKFQLFYLQLAKLDYPYSVYPNNSRRIFCYGCSRANCSYNCGTTFIFGVYLAHLISLLHHLVFFSKSTMFCTY